MDTNDTKVDRGSGNVFQALGHSDPDTHLLKAEIVTCIDEIIRRRGLKQVEAAKLFGLSHGSFEETFAIFGRAFATSVDRAGA